MRTASSRVAGGATRLAAASQPVAQRHAKPPRPSPSSSAAIRGEQHLLDGALDRAHGEALLEDAVGLDLVEALRARRAGATGVAGPAPRSRASEIADETFWVSSKAARSASISPRSNCRWPPAVRRGSG